MPFYSSTFIQVIILMPGLAVESGFILKFWKRDPDVKIIGVGWKTNPEAEGQSLIAKSTG